MSLRAELVRLGLRWFLKPTSRPGVTITRRREQIGNFQRWVPSPPADTEIARGELGGVPALLCRDAAVATRPAYPVSARRRLCDRLAGSVRASVVAHRGGGGGADRGRAVPAGAGAPVSGGARRCARVLARPARRGRRPAPRRLHRRFGGRRLALALALRARDAGKTCRRRSSRCRHGPTSP